MLHFNNSLRRKTNVWWVKKKSSICCHQHLLRFLFAYEFQTVSKSRWCHPSPLDLCQRGSLSLTAWSVCCAAWLRALKHISELWVSLFLTCSLVWREHCAGLEKGLPLWPQISGESKLVSSKGRLPSVIYSPHRDKVRHGHCLCTWAFIRQPGWALCRRHSNVQGAD